MPVLLVDMIVHVYIFKSIAVDELLLPVNEGSDLEQQPSPPVEVLDIMSDSLSKVQYVVVSLHQYVQCTR